MVGIERRSSTIYRYVVAYSPWGGPSIAAGRETINVNVDGTGEFRVPDGNLIFGKSVGTNQNIEISGLGKATVDDPAQFLGSVDIGVFGTSKLGGGEIDLLGLATADSYTYQNDMLSIFSGKSIIDTLRLTNQSPNGFVVKPPATGGSVNIVAITDPLHPPPGLPNLTGVV